MADPMGSGRRANGGTSQRIGSLFVDLRLIFKSVHMLFDGRLDRPWRRGEKRTSTFVFFGRNLDRAELVCGFEACLAR